MRTFIVVVALIFNSTFIMADEKNVSTEISFATVRTELEQEALAYAVSVLPIINKARIIDGEKGPWYIVPDVQIQTGGNDSFQSFTAKLSGFTFKPKYEVEDPDIIDWDSWTNIYVFSGGIESDRNSNAVTSLLELGWTPAGPLGGFGCSGTVGHFGLDDECGKGGIFLQGGYKFKNSDANQEVVVADEAGGNLDQSEEELDSSVARLKLNFIYNFKSKTVSFKPNIDVWYDLVNSETYYKFEAPIKVQLSDDGKYQLEFKYQKGSGAPNFNKGDQFGVGLTLQY